MSDQEQRTKERLILFGQVPDTSASDILFFKIKNMLGRVWVYTEMGVQGEVERGYISQACHSVKALSHEDDRFMQG